MRDAVRQAFVGFTAPMEGTVPFLYLDVKGLVTTAIGNLVDPIGMALGLPFVRPDGELATPDEIRAEWELVKSHQGMAKLGGMAFRKLTALRLTPGGIEQVVTRKLDEMDRHLRKRFVHYDTWPADAQLATLSMSWACGPAFRFPKLEAALMAGDFETAAQECRIDDTNNPGIKPRNVANQTLYSNAHHVVHGELDPETLYWPANAADALGATEPDEVSAHGALPDEAREEDSKNREPRE